MSFGQIAPQGSSYATYNHPNLISPNIYPFTYTPPKPIRTAYTGGTFDLFHPGHVSFLRKCKSLCDTLVVGLNRDEFVNRYKGRYPVMTFSERTVMLENCRYVDRVITNTHDEDSKKAVEMSGAKLVIHGDDWTGESYLKQMGFTQEWLDKKGITLVYVSYTLGISTGEILTRIDDRR